MHWKRCGTDWFPNTFVFADYTFLIYSKDTLLWLKAHLKTHNKLHKNKFYISVINENLLISRLHKQTAVSKILKPKLLNMETI